MSKITNNLGETTQLPNDLSNIKIYVCYSTNMQQSAIEPFKTLLSNYDVTIGTNTPTVTDNYDLVLFYYTVWSIYPELTDNLFNSGINLVTVGNSTSQIFLIKDVRNGSSLLNIHPIVDNMITRKLNITNAIDSDPTLALIHFIDDVEVWYQGTNNNTTYDAVGYYQKNNTEWIYSQYGNYDKNYYKTLIDYIYPENGASYEITKSGTYIVHAYDKAGNITTQTISVQI